MKFVLLPAFVLLLAGCKVELPRVDAGTVELHAGGTVSPGELTPFQLDALLEWMGNHRTGWEFKVEDRAPELLVHLKRRGVTVAVLDICAREVVARDLIKTLRPEEHAHLSRLLASFLNAPMSARHAFAPSVASDRTTADRSLTP